MVIALLLLAGPCETAVSALQTNTKIYTAAYTDRITFLFYHLGLPVSTRMPIDGEEGKRGMIERSKRRENISKKKKSVARKRRLGRSYSSQYRFTLPSRRDFSLSPTVGVRGGLNGFVPHLSLFPRVCFSRIPFLIYFLGLFSSVVLFIVKSEVIALQQNPGYPHGIATKLVQLKR